jgi:hypothetical protein
MPVRHEADAYGFVAPNVIKVDKSESTVAPPTVAVISTACRLEGVSVSSPQTRCVSVNGLEMV